MAKAATSTLAIAVDRGSRLAGISDEKLEELRERVDVSAVVGRRVQLKRSGRDLKGLCPFHGEKTPSFYVVPDKRIYHCFGCGKTGDAIKFVMELEGRASAKPSSSWRTSLGWSSNPRIRSSGSGRRGGRRWPR